MDIPVLLLSRKTHIPIRRRSGHSQKPGRIFLVAVQQLFNRGPTRHDLELTRDLTRPYWAVSSNFTSASLSVIHVRAPAKGFDRGFREREPADRTRQFRARIEELTRQLGELDAPGPPRLPADPHRPGRHRRPDARPRPRQALDLPT